jgi:Calcineurin-like phosphoesterase
MVFQAAILKRPIERIATLPRSALALSSFIALLYLPFSHAGAATLAGWSQYGERGAVEARLVTDEMTCPALIADGKSLPMTERAPPSQAFPVRVCVAVIPSGARHISAGGLALPIPVAHPRHIVLFGDTGCRLKGPIVQDCNDESQWPFRRVAEHAAKERPDLMIHVGDYVYRESPCQPGDSRCAGTPWGDNWPTWNADFFKPAAKLLASTVWLMARGNHEDCSRAGIGWTTLLGHDPMSPSCNPHGSPLLVDLGGVKLALLDDNNAAEKQIDPAVVEALKRDIATAMAAKADWLVTHHPFRGISKADKSKGGNSMEGANANLLAALDGTDEAPLTLMLAGHIHNFQIANYAAGAAPQLVVGEGGDVLDTDVPSQLTGLVSGGKTVTQGLSQSGFGYVVIDRVGGTRDWKITLHAVDGAVLRHCRLDARTLGCDPETTQAPLRGT